MKKITIISAVFLFTITVFTGCEREINTDSPFIEGLSIDNFPIIDGSTSTLPLNTVIAAELLGLNWQWQENRSNNDRYSNTWSIEPQIRGSLRRRFDDRVRSSQTHNSFINLINKEVDMAISVRAMSADERAHAESRGVSVIEVPIAMDAFIMIASPQNQIPNLSLTINNIRDIFTQEIADWRYFGWGEHWEDDDAPQQPIRIQPFIRNPNSGSQELMDLLVMQGLEYKDLPIYEENFIWTMAGTMDAIMSDPRAIGYSVHFFNEYIVRSGDRLRVIAIDGVLPDNRTIRDRSYPLASPVYAVIRSDTDPNSMTFKVFQWLRTADGKAVIERSGYVAY